MSDPIAALRAHALSLPQTAEGVACAGTALEKRTIKVGSKAFLFLGARDAKLKLGDSLAAAADRARSDATGYQVGATGWVTVAFTTADHPEMSRLREWVEESYRLLASKRALAELDART